MKRHNQTDFEQKKVGKISKNWCFAKLAEIASIEMGQSPKSEYYNNDCDGLPFLQGVKTFGERYPFFDTWCTKPIKIAEKGDVLLSVRAPVGKINIAPDKLCIGRGLSAIRGKNTDFIYYLLKNNETKIDNHGTGTVYRSINKTDIQNLTFQIPPPSEQQYIVSILSSLDDKIELNRKMNQTLEEIGKTLFKRWFVDFEFPDDNGMPHKSSGGEMVDSELGMIPKGWGVIKLGEFFPVKTGKQNANIAVIGGKYPFFTCAQDISQANQYSFDSPSILMAGNGDFNVKWYIGKFEAYQRTYVLTPYDSDNLGLLYYLLNYFLSKITSGHRGSVINFITKGMIENFSVALPAKLDYFLSIFNSLNNLIDQKKRDIEALMLIRDSLLPRLMSGSLKVI